MCRLQGKRFSPKFFLLVFPKVFPFDFLQIFSFRVLSLSYREMG
jgi:hypothetical protein